MNTKEKIIEYSQNSKWIDTTQKWIWLWCKGSQSRGMESGGGGGGGGREVDECGGRMWMIDEEYSRKQNSVVGI